MKKHILIFTLLSALMLTCASSELYAQKKSTENDVLREAYEAFTEEKDADKALDLVSKHLKDTPDDINALIFRVYLYQDREEYGKSLTDINHAIKVYNPKASNYDQCDLYWWQSSAYDGLEDYKKAAIAAETAYKLARQEKSENLQDIAFAMVTHCTKSETSTARMLYSVRCWPKMKRMSARCMALPEI